MKSTPFQIDYGQMIQKNEFRVKHHKYEMEQQPFQTDLTDRFFTALIISDVATNKYSYSTKKIK